MTPFALLAASLIVPSLAAPSFPPYPMFEKRCVNETASPLYSEVVAQFPNGTKVENIVIRPNGQILITLFSAPEVIQVDPTGAVAPFVIATLPDVKSATGITEFQSDVFYVGGGTTSSEFVTVPQSYAVFQLNLTTFTPSTPTPVAVTKIATIPDALLLNGITAFDVDAGLLIAADSFVGAIWSLNIFTGEVGEPIQSATMQPTTPPTNGIPFGINGLKVKGRTVYYNNYDTGIQYRYLANADATPAGPVETFVTGLTGADDFEFDVYGNTYLTRNYAGSALQFISADGKVSKAIAGLKGPTSLQWGRTAADNTVVYITSDGGLAGPNKVGGAVFKVDVGVRGVHV